MSRFGFALLGVGTVALGMAPQMAAQTPSQGGWWNPVVIQATQEAPQGGGIGGVLRDAVLGRSTDQPNNRADTRGPAARGRGNGNGNGNAQGNQNQGNGRNGNGPPFCRNGQGHPTKGRQWCEQ